MGSVAEFDAAQDDKQVEALQQVKEDVGDAAGDDQAQDQDGSQQGEQGKPDEVPDQDAGASADDKAPSMSNLVASKLLEDGRASRLSDMASVSTEAMTIA